MRYFFIFIFLALYLETNCNDNDKEEDFIATNEWKTIKKGQKVPGGLHYRINLETGLTEAKLLDETENKNDRKDLLAVSAEESQPDLSVDEIKQVLKNIKGDDVKSSEKIKSKFRSYEELKEELGSINLTSKVDAEVIRDLIKQHKDEFLKDNIDVHTVLLVLEDFDFMAHQFDNGLEFVNQNGFRDVIYKNLNCSYNEIKESTLRLFGSLVQNNARVQIHALETGGIPTLLRLLSSEKSEQVKSNTVFALSCFLRRFPLAQKRFLENGGVYVVLQLLDKSSLKVKLKILTLMSDLFLEKKEAEITSNKLVSSQYKLVNLEEQLIELNWCSHINKLLKDIVNTTPEDHDAIEKILIAMKMVSDKCRNFDKHILIGLKSNYESLAKMDSKDDNFFKELVDICSHLLKPEIKTEL